MRVRLMIVLSVLAACRSGSSDEPSRAAGAAQGGPAPMAAVRAPGLLDSKLTPHFIDFRHDPSKITASCLAFDLEPGSFGAGSLTLFEGASVACHGIHDGWIPIHAA